MTTADQWLWDFLTKTKYMVLQNPYIVVFAF